MELSGVRRRQSEFVSQVYTTVSCPDKKGGGRVSDEVRLWSDQETNSGGD